MLHVVVAADAAAVYLHLLPAYSGYCLSATAVAIENVTTITLTEICISVFIETFHLSFTLATCTFESVWVQ